ncbi:hypothetical protein DPMN_178401 [Dreissena polymorpha]|uniref:Uncharacterized protein n=1 Tax=Dreissena polymorpha TaxID=45954 RepID=A0A9D4EAU7_DREPO|nr:hypothetical protein DPMN_178401 [Dreissena polymorpha]
MCPAFCVRVKRPGLATVHLNGDYEGLVEPVLGDGTACLQPAQSGHRCGRHGNSYSNISCTGTILGQDCAQVLETGHFF